MPDKRLIDANALYDTITDVSNSVGHDVMAVEDVHRCIDKAPTIDAVEVVRCRECMFSKKYMTGNLYCELHNSYAFGVHPDGFCCRGAKIGGGAD